uniref:Uncharacterized protein n=1 Tax=Siphoviridae sp. ctFH16 TaxID=2827817 RepID=A0A8S5TN70_9CAUD|nr:MAG TPA: hypothetical protein [Siphoviridae sp. ctFH16]
MCAKERGLHITVALSRFENWRGDIPASPIQVDDLLATAARSVLRFSSIS